MKTLFAIVLSCFFLALLPFHFQSQARAQTKKPLRLVYVEWPCATITHSIVKVALEERLKQPVELIPASVAIMFQALASGRAEGTLAAWLPDTHAGYMQKLGNKVTDLGPIVSGAKLGWVVPDYVPYKSIEELKGKSKEFKGKIYGIEAGAVYMENSQKAIEEYKLDGFTLIESGDAVMVAKLADAVRKEEPIIVTGWSPHWKFATWKLHFLDDPKNLFGKEEAIHTVVRKGLKEDFPEAYTFLDKFYFKDTQQLQQLMADSKDANPMDVAKKFIKDNPEQVDSWFSKK